MRGICGALLILAALAANAQPSEAASRSAVADATSQTDSAYRDRARTAIHDVLAKPEFADLHSDPYAFWRRIYEWIGDFLEQIRNLPPLLYWPIVGGMILTLVAILGHLIYTLVTLARGTKRADKNAQGRDKITGELLGIQDLDFDKVYAEAKRLLGADEWTAATRYFYVAAILWLDREGAIVFKRSKTNCDYIAELARAGVPPLGGWGEKPPKGGTPAQAFRRLTDLFEPIVYGGRQPTSSNMDDISTNVESLLHAVNSPS
jgi:hypothetical protein